ARIAQRFDNHERGFVHVASVDTLLAELDQVVAPRPRIRPEAGEHARRDFLLAARSEPDGDLYLIVNSGISEQVCEICLPSDTRRLWGERFDTESGGSGLLSSMQDETWGKIRFRALFPPYGGELLAARRATAASLSVPETRPPLEPPIATC